MEEFVGKELRVGTTKGPIEGVMCVFDKDNGIITIQNTAGKHELYFDDVISVNMVESDGTSCQAETKALKEADMYALFYEAFNIYGPFEDHFIFAVAISLKKFLRDFSASSIKIVVGSDDVFGRIGLCFARLALGRAECVSVELRCDLNELKSQKYRNAFENSGGYFDSVSKSFSLALFACNRNGNFEMNGFSSAQTIILDIPRSLPFTNFTGVGLGFIPENSAVCTKPYYLLDVGFGSVLCQKYGIPSKYKNSLVKMDITS